MSFNMTKNASPQNTARSAMLNEYSCSRVVLPRRRESSPPFQSFSPSRQTNPLAALPRKTLQVSKRDRSCPASREPLSIDVQAPLYTLLEVTTPPLMVTPIPHTWATRIRRSFLFPPKRRPSSALVPAIVLIGLLLATSFATLAAAPSAHDASSVSSASATGRNATLWPFSRDSIWNLPIGANAVYVPGNIKKPTASGMTTDVDVLILTPTAPVTKVWENSDAWSGRSRCDAQGGVLFEAPIPTDFVVPGAGSGNPDGTTPNYATAILAADGHTLIQGQPMAPCTAGGTATTADGCAPGCYGGSVPALRMGSLLALPPSIDVNAMGLETGEPAKILAHAFQDYGAYTVDDAAWSVYAVATEYSPSGKVDDEFGAAWNFTISPSSRNVPWARDMDRIFGALAVVDNWDSSEWQVVSASNGTQGVGGGAPRVPWAPDFGPDSVPPVATVSLSGIRGTASWFVSPVDVTLTATDDSSGVASIHYRTDGGTWQLYRNPITVQGDGFHTIDYYATDLAGNNETARTTSFQIDTVGPVSSAQVSGTLANDGSYLSPVTVTLTSSGATSGVQSEQYRIDRGPWTAYSAPFTIGGNGTHVVDYFATDVAGNSETVRSQSIWITGDLHPLPVSTLSSAGTAGASGWYVSSVTVTLEATSGSGSAVSIAYRLDGNAWATYANPIVLLDGRHVLEYQASDAQGYSEPAKSAAINVDSTPPSLVANSPSDPLAPDGSISWSGSDSGSGIARYEVAIDGSAFASVGLQTTLTRTWTVGTHVVSVRAYVAAGNMKSAVVQFNVASNPTPAGPPGAPPSTPPGIPEIVVGLLMLGISMWYRPRVKSRRPVPAK